MGTNVELSRTIWHWCTNHGVRLVYASSAASTATERQGSTTIAPRGLQRLRPLNLYGWTKHAFDLRVARVMAEHGRTRRNGWASSSSMFTARTNTTRAE